VASPLLTLVALVLGVAAAAVLVAALLRERGPDPRNRSLALLAVAVVGCVAIWPSQLRDRAAAVDAQRQSYSGTVERVARERCLGDYSRGDLVGPVGFARDVIPEDARFRLQTDAAVLPCLTLNLLPRRPAPATDFDPSRDWTIFDRVVPGAVRAAIERERRLPEGERRYLVFSPAFVIARPTGEQRR
jgi:hypothetical protein